MWCFLAALLIETFAWVAGGFFTAWLVGPGFLAMGLLDKWAGTLGWSLTLRGWLWAGAIANVVVWWGILFLASLGLARLIRARKGESKTSPGGRGR